DARRIDGAEKQRDLLVDEPGRRQITEQFDQHVRRDADLFDAFAPRGRERRLIRLHVPGDDLDEISLAVGKVGREAKLADEDDLAAGQIDRQHGPRPSRAQYIPRLRVLVRSARAHSLIGTESAGTDFAARDHHVRAFIGDGTAYGYRGGAHRGVLLLRDHALGRRLQVEGGG